MHYSASAPARGRRQVGQSWDHNRVVHYGQPGEDILGDLESEVDSPHGQPGEDVLGELESEIESPHGLPALRSRSES